MGQNGEEEMLAIQEETENPGVPLSLCALLSRMGGGKGRVTTKMGLRN